MNSTYFPDSSSAVCCMLQVFSVVSDLSSQGPGAPAPGYPRFHPAGVHLAGQSWPAGLLLRPVTPGQGCEGQTERTSLQ